MKTHPCPGANLPPLIPSHLRLLSGFARQTASRVGCISLIVLCYLMSGNAQMFPVQSISTTPSAVQDSIVQITAEMQGLQSVAYGDLPRFGTYWEILPGGATVPLPTPTFDPTLPTYAIAGNIFLVDASAGQLAVTPRQISILSTNGGGALIQTEATALANLIEQVQAASVTPAMPSLTMSAIDSPAPPGFGDTSTNSYTPDGLTNTPVSYGTNLWLAQIAVASGYISGIISNSTSDVQFELQYTTNLSTPWQSTNWYVWGSTSTNWTAWVEPAIGSNNLFLRVRSWASADGSGLPIWWETQNFGTNPVNPDAQDPAGDGYSIYQKYILGVPPNTFLTPPAPQGLTALFQPGTTKAILSWQPLAGNVTGYTVEKTYYPDPYSPAQITDNNTNINSYVDNLAADTPDPWNGNIYYISYRVRANYQGGYTSAWSPSLPIQQVTASAAIVPGTNGTTYLAVWGLPANAATVRLDFIDSLQDAYGNHDPSYDYSNNIPVSFFTNGLYQLSAAFHPPLTDSQGSANYAVYVQSVDSAGNASTPNLFDNADGWPTAPYNWGTPFYDGRVQLKQNLIFQLRTAPADGPLQFYYYGIGDYVYPTDYAVASVYQFAEQFNDPGTFDAFTPFEENYLCRNLVFTMTNVDSGGNLTTGVSGGPGTPYYQLASPTFLFNANLTPYQAWLPLGSTSWLLYDQLNNYDDLQSVGIISTSQNGQGETTIAMASGTYNWFGLPYQASGVVGLSATTGNLVNNVISAGHASTSWDFSNPYNIYIQSAQPQLLTVEYDFWNSANSPYPLSPLPGDPAFSTTNASQLLITSVADKFFVVAGYAKLAVMNSVFAGGNNNIYGYLGQYFDTAYTMTNGVATSTNTGILSPYGNFFATQPGQTALVTMPDPDTQMRGTCAVYVVSLQLDKNHDGNMDLSFNGPDATSISSPYAFWINNNFDRTVTVQGISYDDDVAWADSPGALADGDFSYVTTYGQRVIPTRRDLEDFARLWVCGITTNLLNALPAGSTVTLSWGDAGNPNSANPTIDLFAAADANGGIGYLTNETTAAQQIDISQCPYIGRLGPGSSIPLRKFYNNGTSAWLGNHFIWCGCSNGIGALTLTVADANNNVLAQTTSYIQITDIKQMYERWTVGDNSYIAPAKTASLADNDLPAGIPAFTYGPSPGTNTPYILYVHGWNNEIWSKDRRAETTFKRLYWQGYQGRFGSCRWPTPYDYNWISAVFDGPYDFFNGENQAWQSGAGLNGLLNRFSTNYPGHVYLLAHSLGNVVAGEALRLAGTNQLVNTYVASQAALPAHLYDATVTNRFYLELVTPNIFTNWFAAINGGGAGQVINFYNPYDFALGGNLWQYAQSYKPMGAIHGLPNYHFYGTPYDGTPHYTPGSVDDVPPWLSFVKADSLNTYYFDLAGALTNRYEVMSFAAQPRSTALGITAVAPPRIQNNLDLRTIWPLDPYPPYNYSELFWHSGEYEGDNAQQQGYWKAVLHSVTQGFGL